MEELHAIAARVVAVEAGEAGPWTLEVYPTLRCNLDCAFCDTTDRHRPAVGELSPQAWEAIVEEAAALGARRLLVLGGGEPMIAAATPRILTRAKALGIYGVMTTNGTLLSAAHQEMLVEIGWDELHVSLDGALPETHDALRGRAGAFRKTVQAICRLRQRRAAAGRGPRLALHTVLTCKNVEEIPAIVRLAAALGCFRVDFDALIAYRPEQRALQLRPEQAARLPEIAAAGVAVAAACGVETTLAQFLTPAPARGERAPPRGEGSGLRAAPCLKAWHHLVVQADGRTSPCCVLAGEGEAVEVGGLARLWGESPFLTQLRASMRAGVPGLRCKECSENILHHERAIRAQLPMGGG